MTPELFIECCAKEKADMLAMYMKPSSGSQVAVDIEALNLSEEQRRLMRKIVSEILTDTFYTILYGLDGEASIGGRQEIYDLRSEDGTLLTKSGELQGLVSKHFHDTHSDPDAA